LNYGYLRGGFANRFFQLAFFDWVARQSDSKFMVILPEGESGLWRDVFKSLDFAAPESQKDSVRRAYLFNRLPIKLIRLINRVRQPNFVIDSENVSEGIDRFLETKPGDWHWFGYWQLFGSQVYDRSLQQLRGHLVQKLQFDALLRSDRSTICIHVRLKDYGRLINRMRFETIAEDYYVKWIDRLSIDITDLRLVLVTDEPQHPSVNSLLASIAKTNPHIPVEVRASNNLLNDLVEIASARYRIIGNSSFALLGCRLADEGLSVIPARWYRFRRSVPNLRRAIYAKV